MKKACGFLIICLVLVACKAPQLATTTVKEVVTIRDTVLVAAPVAATETAEEVVFDDWAGGDFLDIITVQDSFSFASIEASGDAKTGKRKYKVTTGRKPDTVYVDFPVVLTDTITIECPPTLPAMPTDGRFPWWWLLGTLVAFALYFSVGRKPKD